MSVLSTLTFPSFTKFATKTVHVTVLNVREFHENQRREDHSCLIGVNEITFSCVPRNCMTYSKERLLRHGVENFYSFVIAGLVELYTNIFTTFVELN